MAWQAFGTLAAGNQSLSLFDTAFGQVAQTVNVPTTATGTNAIALALNASAPNITSYANYQSYTFVAVNTSTGSVTVNVNSIGALPLYKPGAIQAGSGDIISGVLYEIVYNSALNAGGGGFQITSATPATLSLPVTVPNGGTGLTSLTPYAIMCGGTGSAANMQQVASLGSGGQLLTSQGSGALPTWTNPPSTSGVIIGFNSYGSSQTITIPSGATKGWVWLVGGGAGGNSSNSGGSGAGLLKLLTGMTSGNTLSLTVGGAGSNASNTGGGSSSLSSGSQSITTLTAGGGNAGSAGSGGTGGTASNGDLNITGQTGVIVGITISGGCGVTATILNPAIPGILGLIGTFGNGGSQANSPAITPQAGVCFILWFS
jgi:hypothetical protein